MAIQHRRGNYSNFDPSKLLPGEPAVVQSGDPSASDGKAVYVAFAAGDVKRLATHEDIVTEIENSTEEVAQDLTEQFTTSIQTYMNKAQGYANDASESATNAASSAEAAQEAVESFSTDKTLSVTDKPADAKATGDAISDLNGAIDYIENGKIQKLDAFVLPYGNFALDDNISTPTASNYRVAYNKLITMDEEDVFVFQSDGAYNISFAKFDNTGKCTKSPARWLNDGNYSYSDIMNEIGSVGDSHFSFQLKLANNTIIYPNVVMSTAFCALVRDIPVTIDIADDSITEDKLSPEVRAKLNGSEPVSDNLLEDIALAVGAYVVGDSLGSASTGTNRSRLNYSVGFALEDGMVFTANTNGAYNLAFCGFDANGVCISTPYAWLNDGTYTADQIKANARSTEAAKYTFQIKAINDAAISGDISAVDYYKLEKTEHEKTVDVIMFMGQSNMAGRGTAADAPIVINGAGYEYRAISAPNTLTPMVEPFGATEANPSGIDEGSSKTGSMVAAFTNAYFLHNGNIPVVGISASKGGTPIADWQPNGAYLTDAIARLNGCVTYLNNNGYTIRHKYILWCQGETDGDDGTTAEQYKSLFESMLSAMKAQGIEKLFLVRIGNYNSGTSTKYNAIMDAQTEIAQTNTDVVMASTDLAGMRARGLMKDAWHYYQAAYNEVGTYAGVNVALYEQTGKESTMYDTKDGTLYYSHKN